MGFCCSMPCFTPWSWRNQGLREPLYVYRDSNGLEIDLLLEHAEGIQLVEIKASPAPLNEAIDTH